jgi:hypothetical protein
LSHFHYALLFLAAVSGLTIIAKNGFSRSLCTLNTYVIVGCLFETLYYIKNHTLFGYQPTYDTEIVYFYSINLYPVSISASIIIRRFKIFMPKLIIYLLVMALLFYTLDNFLFIAINHTITIAGILLFPVLSAINQSLKWDSIIDFLMAVNFYIMFITKILSIKFQLWQSSIYLKYSFYVTGGFLILTLILIHVKFWRSFTR